MKSIKQLFTIRTQISVSNYPHFAAYFQKNSDKIRMWSKPQPP